VKIDIHLIDPRITAAAEYKGIAFADDYIMLENNIFIYSFN